jgi:hypothetical protein
MTQLELFEDTHRPRVFRFDVRHALASFFAVLKARAALARIKRESQQPWLSADIPNYLRRDLGLPELDTPPSHPVLVTLAILRLK